jgi:hypothetical protein
MREHRRQMMRRMHERHHGNDGERMQHRMGPPMQEGTTGEQL